MDLKGLSIDELHRRAIAARQVKGTSEVTLMFLLAELEDRKVYLDYGCSSISHYAQFHLRLDARKARELARLGRVVGQLPHLLDGFTRGEIEYSQLREISRVATTDDEQQWLDIARARTSNQIQRIVARVKRGQSIESATDAGDEDADDEMTLRFTLTKDEGRRLKEALREARRTLPGCEDGAIFYALVMKAAADLKDDVMPPVNTVVLYHDPESHVTVTPTPAGFEEVAESVFERCLCDGALIDMRPLGVEAKTSERPPELKRTLPRAVRRAVMFRDAFRCSVPGCTHTLYMEIHHLDEFWRGGTHDLDNLTLLCTRHHGMWHEKLVHATGKPSTGLHWTDARGRPIGITPPRVMQPEVSETLQKQPHLWGGRMLQVLNAA
ncbi:MAG: HNH endonuclease signature motif containing protein [Candidatus Xenobia bacterium]